jgi:hypothetical protein
MRSTSSGPTRRNGRGTLPAPIASAAANTERAALAISDVLSVAATAKLFALGSGLYALSVGEAQGAGADLAGLAMPATHIAHPWLAGRDPVEVVTGLAGRAGWLGPEGGTVVVKVPSDGGQVLITTYRAVDQQADPLEIQITRLDRPNGHAATLEPLPRRAAPETAKSPAENGAGRRRAPTDVTAGDIKAEIVVHIERRGDCRFTTGEWLGERGRKLRIEAFSIRPLERLSPEDIEYKAFGPNGRETPWVTGARLCGTRGRGVPLTGFAVRLVPHLQDRYDAVYHGGFFDSGVAGPRRNGEACTPSRVDDPLEAVNIRLIARPVP